MCIRDRPRNIHALAYLTLVSGSGETIPGTWTGSQSYRAKTPSAGNHWVSEKMILSESVVGSSRPHTFQFLCCKIRQRREMGEEVNEMPENIPRPRLSKQVLSSAD